MSSSSQTITTEPVLTAHGQSVARLRRHGVNKGQGTVHVAREELEVGLNYTVKRCTETTNIYVDKLINIIEVEMEHSCTQKRVT